ncbi:MAG: helix-turn-helix transcriptional regulator [Epulopiscium sp.]|jgi:transcriptional regulator with XRE-family HTH domain|nr:helix-turn-helix transcriptional regulator [Candidatus Epulonipiscium sp.]HOQ17569.1 helix-turn-helix transcriptional regulator [Defluviitaleaceae bacterium]HPT77410.1 helix-turn-helix transcriptional regulator [Defluviitaleaceae bacterium]
MELGKQIKKYRKALSLSQDALAEKIFVSRQTISNWENDKSYPDINSLILLSEVFNTSIDNLVKGDVETMKKEISQFERKRFNELKNFYAVLLILDIVIPTPLFYFLKSAGVVIWVLISALTIYIAFQLEKEKKKYDIQTYREIVAFLEGKNLNEIEKAKEEGKRLYQKLIAAIASLTVAMLIAIGFNCILR